MKEFGVAHSDASTVEFAFSRMKVFGPIFIAEGASTNKTAPEYDADMRDLRNEANESRALVVALQGSAQFLISYRESLKEPDYVFYCATESILDQMGLDVIDRGWAAGDKAVDLDRLIDDSFTLTPGNRLYDIYTDQHPAAAKDIGAKDPNASRSGKQLMAGAIGFLLGRVFRRPGT